MNGWRKEATTTKLILRPVFFHTISASAGAVGVAYDFCIRHDKCVTASGSLGKFQNRERNGAFGLAGARRGKGRGAARTKSVVERRIWKFPREPPQGERKSAGFQRVTG